VTERWLSRSDVCSLCQWKNEPGFFGGGGHFWDRRSEAIVPIVDPSRPFTQRLYEWLKERWPDWVAAIHHQVKRRRARSAPRASEGAEAGSP
jgi:hypothetical protein